MAAVSFDTSRTDLSPMPINPAWIRDGNPVARSLTLGRSPDSLVSTGLWDCTAGTFVWVFQRDEIAHIIEGEARVRDGDTTHVLVPGRVAYFPSGLTTVWEVPKYVKKAYVLRGVPPPPGMRASLRAALRAILRR